MAAAGEHAFQFSSRYLALLGFLLSFLTMATALAAAPGVCVALVSLLVALLLWRRHALVELVNTRHSQAESSAMLTADDVSLEERVERAAAYVHDALDGRFRGVHWAVGAQSRIFAQRLLKSLKYTRGLNLTIYLALALVERPSWCYWRRTCGTADMRSGLPELSVGVTQSVEAVCIALFAGEMALKAYCMSARAFFGSPWHVIQMLLITVNGAIVVVQAALYADYHRGAPLPDALGGVAAEGVHGLAHPNGSDSGGGGAGDILDRPQAAVLNYLNPMLRPILFVALSRSVRRSLRSFVRVVPAVLDIFFLVLLLLLFGAALGVLLFDQLSEKLSEMKHSFATVGDALLSLHILLTTANFPDVMLPVYDLHRSASFFFVAFLVIGVFILMNLVRAHRPARAPRRSDASRERPHSAALGVLRVRPAAVHAPRTADDAARRARPLRRCWSRWFARTRPTCASQRSGRAGGATRPSTPRSRCSTSTRTASSTSSSSRASCSASRAPSSPSSTAR